MKLAENQRTRVKATIKRASARARLQMNSLDRSILQQLEQIYVNAANDIEQQLKRYADGENNLRIEVLQDIRQQIDRVINNIRDQRNRLLNSGLEQAANIGLMPYESVSDSSVITRIADESLRFVRSFVAADGLQLSDRIWRLDNGARQALVDTIESGIVQGWGASEAANQFLNNGQPVPGDIQNKMRAGSAETLAKQSRRALLSGAGSPRHNAMRVFRTEINRAHGEAYISAGETLDDYAGWKFLLSPKHPETDICDMHARVNRYGLGPGVYPDRKRTPWPAHPNTLSYVEIVFADEITAADKAGRLNRIDWLKEQSADVQRAVLGSGQKRAALQRGILRESEISTPWKVLKKRYSKRGINVDELNSSGTSVVKINGTVILGISEKEMKKYIDDAWSGAPDVIHRVIANTKPVKSIQVTPSGESYYVGGRIFLSRRDMKVSMLVPSIHDVYRHEFGHFIDFSKDSQISLIDKKNGGIGDSIKKTRDYLYLIKKTNNKKWVELSSFVDRANDLSLQDLFGSLTLNKIGAGHSVSYLKRRGRYQAEVFANLFNLYSRSDRKAWEYVRSELPDLANDFIKILEGL